MPKSTSRIVFYQTIVPDYRVELFRGLIERCAGQLTVACGEQSFLLTLRTAPEMRTMSVALRNHFWLGRRLLWQEGLLPLASEADLVIAEFSLRSLSTWWLLAHRHRAGKPTILWGHSSGRSRLSGLIRRWMIRRCNGFIAYMPREKQKLQAVFPDLRVWVAPNAMMKEADCHPLFLAPEKVRDIIYVGRLVVEKKVRLLLDGFAHAVKNNLLPTDTRLVFVGDGPEAAGLRDAVAAQGLQDQVLFRGHVLDVDRLRDCYASALVAVSPGYVGLSVTQALSFGVPVLAADHEPHSPEIELCAAGRNAEFFRADGTEDLGRALAEIWRQKQQWLDRRESISVDIRRHYSFEAMQAAMLEAMAAFL